MTRAWYDRTGYVLHPAYKSLCADDDLHETARLAGKLVDARSKLSFIHHHRSRPGGGPDDATYQHTSSASRLRSGQQTFLARQQLGFPE
jgi:hypothetical protein